MKNTDFWLQRVIVRLVLKLCGSFWAQNVKKTMQLMFISNFFQFGLQMFRTQQIKMKILVRNKKIVKNSIFQKFNFLRFFYSLPNFSF